MKTIALLLLLLLPANALAQSGSFSPHGKSVTISVSAEVMSFQALTEEGECSINGDVINCSEIDGFVEQVIPELTTPEEKDTTHAITNSFR